MTINNSETERFIRLTCLNYSPSSQGGNLEVGTEAEIMEE